jgi:hypothetical protein
MHINGIYVKLLAAGVESEARTNTRFDALECKIDAILVAAGIIPLPLPAVARVGLPAPARQARGPDGRFEADACELPGT